MFAVYDSVVIILLFGLGTQTNNHVNPSSIILKHNELVTRSLNYPNNVNELYYSIKYVEKEKIPITLNNNACELVKTTYDSISIATTSQTTHYYRNLFILEYIYRQKYCNNLGNLDIKSLVMKEHLDPIESNENRYFCDRLMPICNCKCPMKAPKDVGTKKDFMDRVYEILQYTTNPNLNTLSSYNNTFISLLENYNTYVDNNEMKLFVDDSLFVIFEAIRTWMLINIENMSPFELSKIASVVKSIVNKIPSNGDICLQYNLDGIVELLNVKNVYDPIVELDSIDGSIVKLDSNYEATIKLYVLTKQKQQLSSSLESSVESLSVIKLACNGKPLVTTTNNLSVATHSKYMYTLPVDFSGIQKSFSNGQSYQQCKIKLELTPKSDYTYIQQTFELDFAVEMGSIKLNKLIQSCNIVVEGLSNPIDVPYGTNLSTPLKAYNYETITITIKSNVYGFLYFTSENNVVILKPDNNPGGGSSTLTFSLVLSNIGNKEFLFNSGLYTIKFMPIGQHLASPLDSSWMIGSIDIEFFEEPIIHETVGRVINLPKTEIIGAIPPKPIQGCKCMSIMSILFIGSIAMFVLIKWKAMGVSLDCSKIMIPSHILFQIWLCFMFSLYLYFWTSINMMSTLKIAIPVSIIVVVTCKNIL